MGECKPEMEGIWPGGNGPGAEGIATIEEWPVEKRRRSIQAIGHDLVAEGATTDVGSCQILMRPFT